MRLSQDMEVADEIYLQLVNRAQELNVVKAGTIGNVRVIDRAFGSPIPVAPGKSRIVGLALVLGLMSGVGLVLVNNALASGVRSSEELEKLGLSVYATVPLAKQAARDSKRRPRDILALKAPEDMAVEALRSLRTGLHFGMLDAENALVMITSPRTGDGKSFLAINLAVVLAQSGAKTCLVDLDLRRGYLNRYFGLERKDTGVVDFLAGDADFAAIVRPSPVSNLSYVITGAYPPNPSELLMHPRFSDLVQKLDAEFDIVILDTPPVHAVTDSAIVGRHVGAVLLATRFDHTKVDEIDKAVRALETAGIKPTGAVLNGYDIRKARRSGAGSYAGEYRYAYTRRK